MLSKKEKPVIWCVVGPSGGGKSTLANQLDQDDDWNVICSYTTRPMREDEEEGREHYFITEEDYLRMKDLSEKNIRNMDVFELKQEPNSYANRFLAYTMFGGHHYFARHSQIDDSRLNLYVIDEDGYRELVRKFGFLYDIHLLHVTCNPISSLQRGVTEDRLQRDARRQPLDHFEFHIDNDFGMELFQENVTNFSKIAKQMYG